MRFAILSVSMLVLAGDPLSIDHFVAAPDCIMPDPHRGILSFAASGGILRYRLDAIHSGGRVRAFSSETDRTPIPAIARSGVADPGAASDVVAYRLTVTGERGVTVERTLPFRYRRAVFELVPPATHIRATSGGDHLARYETAARVAHVDSLSCRVTFDAPVEGVLSRAGTADIVTISGEPHVRCSVRWHSTRRARAAGTVEWTARVTDTCTQGRIMRTARVNAIP
jgi:hypothetical protein